MDNDLAILTALLDPCLTADEAEREAAARTHRDAVEVAMPLPRARGARARSSVSADRVNFMPRY